MSLFSPEDHKWMARALKLAKKGEFTTSPNPNVGCVIVRDNHLVGEGFHFRTGEPHAEVYAMRMAGEKAKGATAYVTLEPCSHYGRTPPCAKGLIEAGVSRVVAAMVDPNPQVAGRGLKMLEDAGIEVSYGLMQAEAEKLNRGFIKKMRENMPFVQLKLAASIDGRTALGNGESKWITGSEARRDVQKYRAKASAILSTSATVIADNPSLTVRYSQLPDSVREVYQENDLRQPVRVIIDSQNRLTADYHLFSLSGEILLIRTKTSNISYPENVQELLLPEKAGKVDLQALFNLLAEKGLQHVWVEAGATFAGAILEAGFVDEFILYQAPKLIGDKGRALLNLSEKTLMAQIPELEIKEMLRVGNDIKLCLQVL